MDWSDEELTILKENYGKIPTKKLAARLKRTEPSIRSQARIQGLQKKGKTRKPWTYADDLQLYNLYHSKFLKGRISIKGISKILHRTVKSIEFRLSDKKLRYLPPDPNANYAGPGRKKSTIPKIPRKNMMLYKIYNTQVDAGFIKEANDEI